MSWGILLGLVVLLGLALWVRRGELRATRSKVAERVRARERGSDRARLQYPEIDLSRCIGCGICVEACPEEGVLEIIHGQALVVHGARCVGHGRCAAECPVGAIALTLGDLSERDDIPVLTEALESTLQPGVFLAGEVTGYALIRTAIAHGTAVADEVARRVAADASSGDEAYDLVVVGAGPAGLACSLEAKAQGLSFVTLEQEELGGTVARYPRRKLVMTQPVELPLHGPLTQTSYLKEELVEIWAGIVERLDLPVRTGQTFVGIERSEAGHLVVKTQTDSFAARHVCLALGRRGTPRKLGVPGEDLPKVAYALLDAQSYQGRRILIVGGGDSAVEAAMGLAEQPGNEVSISYRRSAFVRLKAKNELAMTRFIEEGRLAVHFDSQVQRIEPERVVLQVGPQGQESLLELQNDEVFVFAGGVAPVELLRGVGVSFDPSERRPVAATRERGTGLWLALLAGFVCSLAALGWAFAFRDYYALPLLERPHHPWHGWLKPSGVAGLTAGGLALLSIFFNLAYLARRTPKVRFEWGSLQAWMTAHVATGVLALVLAVVHSAMLPRHTVGGHALAGLVVLVLTGAIGRYLYSFVPRAANGRELLLDEAKAELAKIASGWDQTHRAFGERVRAEVQRLVASGHWAGSLVSRIRTLVTGQRSLERRLTKLGSEGLAEGVPAEQVAELLALARAAYRASLAASHYEDLRGVLASWRYLHRWVALLVVLLVALHVAVALKYAAVFAGFPG